ncbi:PilW family protein [Acinetobacter baumannii]|uniref:PilW family protein n=1 Tax=Acinetobacter baumannii TaxID=470 RepID=UPI00044F9921|nr:PilW family protein [Acinetobacter baumannii]EZI52956.1 prepilin-type N-terminal cleavage/methylation domain protein [Acinetobacter baumannii 42057_2]
MAQSFISNKEQGFTLIELIVALALGLILVAAATQLFIGGLLSSRLQKANAEIQDSGIFGFEYMARDIRLLNYGNVVNPQLTDTTPWGGIVLTGSTATNANNINFIPKVDTNTYIPEALLSRGAGDTVSTVNNYWKGLSNIQNSSNAEVQSDQLTIQFIAPTNMTNCEGVNVLAGDLIVQRYFLRVDNNGSSQQDYALACDANTPAVSATAQPDIVNGLGDAGQIILPRIDHFHVLLGAKNAAGNFAYYTIPQYRVAAQAARDASPAVAAPRILSIQISVLARSTNNAQNKAIDPNQSFLMLDQNVHAADNRTRFLRRVYSVTIALRNAMGETI